MFKRLFVLLMLLLSVIAVPLLFASNSAGEETLKVTVSVNEAEQTAEVGPGDSGVVVFTGQVACNFPSGYEEDSVSITLEGKVGYWRDTMAPTSFVLHRKTPTRSFTYTVTVPIGTSHVTTQQVGFVGMALNESGDLLFRLDPVNAMINVKQFYAFELECENSEASADQGGKSDFQIKISNKGNDQDTFKIGLNNEDALEKADIDIQLSQTEYIIDEGSDQVLKMNVILDDKTPPGTHEIELKVFSYQAMSLGEEQVEEVFTFTISVKRNAPGLEAAGLLMMVILVMAAPALLSKKKKK